MPSKQSNHYSTQPSRSVPAPSGFGNCHSPPPERAAILLLKPTVEITGQDRALQGVLAMATFFYYKLVIFFKKKEQESALLERNWGLMVQSGCGWNCWCSNTSILNYQKDNHQKTNPVPFPPSPLSRRNVTVTLRYLF